MPRRRDRHVVDSLIAAGATPARLKGSEGVSLVQGKRRVRLTGDDGTVTIGRGSIGSKKQASSCLLVGFCSRRLCAKEVWKLYAFETEARL
jgi:hypothetical protein